MLMTLSTATQITNSTNVKICRLWFQLTRSVLHQSSVQVRTRLHPALRTQSFSSRGASLPSTKACSAALLSVTLFRSTFFLSNSLSTFWKATRTINRAEWNFSRWQKQKKLLLVWFLSWSISLTTDISLQ